jgi:hypothetical protein
MTNIAVARWTGRLAVALQEALRLSQEAFAEQLGVVPRTVANWHAQPERELRPATKGFLDTLLARSDAQAQQRFAILAGDAAPLLEGASAADEAPTTSGAAAALERELSRDPHIGAALAWLDEAAAWTPGVSRREVAQRLTRIELHAIQDRGNLRSRVTQGDIAGALAGYYGAGHDDYEIYRARCEGRPLTTSVVTKPDWLDLRLSLGAGNERITFAATPEPAISLDDVGAVAAVQRLAEGVATNTRIVNAPLYRLTDIQIGSSLAGVVGLTHFAGYALTLDLLENELVDAVAASHSTRPGALPLRDRYLPTLAGVVEVGSRLCVGGVLALCAIARPGRRGHRSGSDYLLLVQERSGRVLNAARRLAVIPKAFHEPLVDYREDAQFFMTLEREMEEELFGRDDVDSALTGQQRADPMHLSRLSPPMRWLVDHVDGGHWRKECTAFGYNLVSGNFECACLVVIDDEEWWERFGGDVAANWESDGLRRYSSADVDTMTSLIGDPSWSNEGLFAMLQGLRRLSETGGNRVNLPQVELERAE